MELHDHAVVNEFGYADVRRMLEATGAVERQAPLQEVTKIPTVVHIVYHTESQNISDDVVHDQIQILNEDFRAQNADLDRVPDVFKNLIADPKIEFELAKRDPLGAPTSGITRKQTSIQQFPQATPPIGIA